jgi:hypothetical protein
MSDAGTRYVVTFYAVDGTRHVVAVWASSEERAVADARTWLRGAQELKLEDHQPNVEAVGSEPNDSNLGIARTNEAVNHQRFARSGESLSTFFRPDSDHIRRFTRRLREDASPDWERARSLLAQHGPDSRRVAVASSAADGPDPPRVMTLVAERRRVFSLFLDAHPKMEDGLPVLIADATFVVEPGPALIELPRSLPTNGLIEAAFAILDEEQRTS